MNQLRHKSLQTDETGSPTRFDDFNRSQTILMLNLIQFNQLEKNLDTDKTNGFGRFSAINPKINPNCQYEVYFRYINISATTWQLRVCTNLVDVTLRPTHLLAWHTIPEVTCLTCFLFNVITRSNKAPIFLSVYKMSDY